MARANTCASRAGRRRLPRLRPRSKSAPPSLSLSSKSWTTTTEGTGRRRPARQPARRRQSARTSSRGAAARAVADGIAADGAEARPRPSKSLQRSAMPQRASLEPLALLLLTAVYFVAGKLGLLAALVHASASPVWP